MISNVSVPRLCNNASLRRVNLVAGAHSYCCFLYRFTTSVNTRHRHVSGGRNSVGLFRYVTFSVCNIICDEELCRLSVTSSVRLSNQMCNSGQ